MARFASVFVVGLALAGLLMVGCAQSGGGSAAGDGCADCTQMMKTGDGWCNGCAKGMVDHKSVKCKGCYKAKTGGPACAKCAK